VSTGYLAALAGRSLGVVPLLRPATPSRFEPSDSGAGLHELAETTELEFDRATVQAASAPTSVGAAPEVGTRRNGSVLEVGKPSTPVDGLPRSPSQTAEADSSGRDRRSDPNVGRDDTETPTGRLAELEAVVPRAPEVPYDSRRAAMPPSRRETAARSPAIRSATSRSETRTSTEPSRGEVAVSDAPAIVVKIGRVDVQAVQAAQPAIQAGQLRRPASRTLADHLRSRDRGRQ
jgi:hypothetical protein